MHSRKHVLLLAATLALAATVTAFAAAAGGGGSVVKLGSTSLGRVLVDSHGKTLYVWAHDKTSKSTCYGDCAGYWPPLVSRGRPVALGGAQSKLVGTSKRPGGRSRVSYAGHPLHYSVQDGNPR